MVVEYSGKLLSHDCSIENIDAFSIYLNDTKLNAQLDKKSGIITFNDFSFGQTIFKECYGLVQFSLTFTLDNEEYSLDSDYIQIMVKKGLQNDSIRRMTEFIYNHDKTLLYNPSTLPTYDNSSKNKSLKTLETKVSLLKEIAKVYEKNYSYFKTNARFKMIPKGDIDSFEKLQYLGNNTIQYIAQHPNELNQVLNNKGIKYNNKYYVPNKTLVMKNTNNYDIYENRCVINFLRTLVLGVNTLRQQLNELISSIPQISKEENGYISSSYFVYLNSKDLLETKYKDLEELYKKITELYKLYKNTLIVQEEIIYQVPKLTHVFQSIPQYRQIYNLMLSWFKYCIYDLEESKYMLSFVRTSQLYETYVLTKLIEYFSTSDFSLQKVDKLTYKFNTPTYYKNTDCNNLFVFKRDKITVTLYYQPVIYNKDNSDITGIGLYRTTSISYPLALDDEKEKTGTYYTPDYLIKIQAEDSDECRYIILDAKFSSLNTTKYIQLPSLTYKYLFSVSPIHPTDKVVAMYIINGQSEELEDKLTEVFDYSLASNPPSPNVSLLTLTENSEENTSLHKSLFRHCLGPYLK